MADVTVHPGLPDPQGASEQGASLCVAPWASSRRKYGPGSMEKVMTLVEPDLREALAGLIHPSAWYPFRFQVGLYEAVDRAFGRGDYALCREIRAPHGRGRGQLLPQGPHQAGQPEVLAQGRGLHVGHVLQFGNLRVEEMGGAGT